MLLSKASIYLAFFFSIFYRCQFMYGELTDKETVSRLEYTLENQLQDQFEVLLYKSNSEYRRSVIFFWRRISYWIWNIFNFLFWYIVSALAYWHLNTTSRHPIKYIFNVYKRQHFNESNVKSTMPFRWRMLDKRNRVKLLLPLNSKWHLIQATVWLLARHTSTYTSYHIIQCSWLYIGWRATTQYIDTLDMDGIACYRIKLYTTTFSRCHLSLPCD